MAKSLKAKRDSANRAGFGVRHFLDGAERIDSYSQSALNLLILDVAVKPLILSGRSK